MSTISRCKVHEFYGSSDVLVAFLLDIPVHHSWIECFFMLFCCYTDWNCSWGLLVGGWTNPFEKKQNIVKMGIFPKWGWKHKIFELPPPRLHYSNIFREDRNTPNPHQEIPNSSKLFIFAEPVTLSTRTKIGPPHCLASSMFLFQATSWGIMVDGRNPKQPPGIWCKAS